MGTSEVAELLAALRGGRMSLDDVADRFRRRVWPAARRTPPTTFAEMADQEDVDIDVAGSYDEVTAAYDRGELTSDQYRVLSDAVAEGIDAAAGHEGPDSGAAPAQP